jgi:archaellum biogenesis ATPase FlaH
MLISNFFHNITNNPEFFRVVYPHIMEDYFTDATHKIIFRKIKEYNLKYSKIPSGNDVKLLIETDNGISENDSEECYSFLQSLKEIEKVNDINLLTKQVETWCQNRALEIAILDGVAIIQNGKESKGLIKDKIEKALAVEFDIQIGEDYFRDVKKRFDEYFQTEDKIKLNLENLNLAMGGGLVKKAIFFFMANTGIGKSIFLAHCTSSLIQSSQNVLYLSGELSCKEVQKRLDANLLSIPINSLNQTLDKNLFKSRVKEIFSKTHGELIVKFCSAGTVNALHIKNIINEIKLKRGYIPDVIVIDHLTLFSSSRLPQSQAGTHLYIRATVEEIRAVAIEYDCNILTACQLNRGAKSKGSDTSNEDVALGYAISETSDWSSAIIQTSELKEQNKFLLKVMKSRFSSNTESIYNIGIDYEYMRLLDVDNPEAIPLHIQDRLKNKKQQDDHNEESGLYDSFDFN